MPIARRAPRTGLLVFIFAAAVALAGCADPPDKEINQAVGAIDAARAAGAERYAPDEFATAAAALDRARTAVDQRDYRLALSHALDARERAQDAARTAAAERAEARSHADVLVAQVSQSLTELRATLDAARSARVPARELADGSQMADRAEAALQEARAAVDREEYGKAAEVLEPLPAALQAAIAGVPTPAGSRPARGRS